jgi:hypothetical protein
MRASRSSAFSQSSTRIGGRLKRARGAMHLMRSWPSVEAHRAQHARDPRRLEGKRPERQGRHHGSPARQDPRFEAHRPEAAFEHALASQLLGLGHAGIPAALRPIRGTLEERAGASRAPALRCRLRSGERRP